MSVTAVVSPLDDGLSKNDIDLGEVDVGGEAGRRLALPPVAETASGRPWRLKLTDEAIASEIAVAANISRPLARILASRGVNKENVEGFLAPSLRNAMPDPFVLKDMALATERLAKAVTRGETIGVFGDYDVDGASAAAILKQYFKMIDAPMEVYLPDRLLEGYGPTVEAFEALKKQGASLIVTVDCGAAAYDPIAAAAALGVDVVVIDHHLMQGAPPPGAAAVVNPNRPDDTSGLENLSAAGLAFMAVVALNRALRDAGWFKEKTPPDLRALLDLAALGTVCDVMPLTGFARVIVAQGLKVLAAGEEGPGNKGLQALAARAGARKASPSAYDFGFVLGPRINAAGRIGHARLAFDLLTTDKPDERLQMAERLHILNAERQAIEAAVQAEADAMIERDGLAAHPVIVVARENWHPGVIGVVAGRLKERYDRPVVVIGVDPDSAIGKGSGRSISGVDLGAVITAARAEGMLTAGGGHALAAGLTIEASRIEALRAFLCERLGEAIERAREARVREIDALVAPSAVCRAFADEIALGGPYGAGNPEPLFAISDVTVDRLRTVGDSHLAFELTTLSGDRVRAIAFRAVGTPLEHMLRAPARTHEARRMLVAGKIKADDWRGGDAAQFQVIDMAEISARVPGPCPSSR